MECHAYYITEVQPFYLSREISNYMRIHRINDPNIQLAYFLNTHRASHPPSGQLFIKKMNVNLFIEYRKYFYFNDLTIARKNAIVSCFEFRLS